MQPPLILQICREPLKAGTEAAYDAIERETARICARLGCPNPYLGAEALTGPKQVWYFNGYASDGDRQRVSDAYAANATLMKAITASGSRKRPLTLPAIDALARFREDLSHGRHWAPGAGRFLVVAVTDTQAPGASGLMGTVFETDKGTRFTIVPAQSRGEAETTAAAARSPVNLFRVRPDWSFPSPEWVMADRAFWEAPEAGRAESNGVEER